jgi:YHS domain-containing protein
MAIDPVCKRQVEEKTAAGKSEYRGKPYYFCSDQCKQAFDRNPERYVNEKVRTAGGR